MEYSGKQLVSCVEEADWSVVLWVCVLALVFEDFYYKSFRPLCGEFLGGEDLVEKGEYVELAVLVHPFVGFYWGGV